MSSIRRLVRDNSMSILFGLLFVATLVGQAVTGYHAANQQLTAHGRPALSIGSWLSSGGFLNALAVNWQAAILQLATLVLAGAVLYQRGASHSRDPDKDKHESPEDEHRQRDDERRFTWVRRHSSRLRSSPASCSPSPPISSPEQRPTTSSAACRVSHP